MVWASVVSFLTLEDFTIHKHGLINYIGTKAKCCHLTKLTCNDFAAGVNLSEAGRHVAGIWQAGIWQAGGR